MSTKVPGHSADRLADWQGPVAVVHIHESALIESPEMITHLWPVRFSTLLAIHVAACIGAAQTRSPKVNPVLEFRQKLMMAAVERTHHFVRYDGRYVRIAYPGGDVPADTGVCTDEIIRSYRAVGVDLQKQVHEDMLQNFAAYPNSRRWGLDQPDPNIDHRRVPNLMVFFSRKGEILPISESADAYSPGDIVTWDLGGGVLHIGIVVDQKGPQNGRFYVVHNIGAGPKMEDVLFRWKIIGHYRYNGPNLQQHLSLN
jgi:uncharacterized protein YijF (DUF1287 family)